MLPLSADVEVSDYPTLDEVEQMAVEASQFAHSIKPDSLPLAANSKWKDDFLSESVKDDCTVETVDKVLLNDYICKSFFPS